MSSATQEQRATHTPGPWTTVRYQRGGHARIQVQAAGRHGIADIAATNGGTFNARLIAAAPALLAELERMYEAARCMADPEHCLHAQRDELPWNALADQARAAIAAATA